MKTRLLSGVLCVLAGALRAQPQLAERIDTTAAAPVWGPVPAAVLTVCRQLAPEIVASPAAVWTMEDGYYSVSIPRIRLVQGTTDTVDYSLQAYANSTGHRFGFDKEIPANTLPWRVRWALQDWVTPPSRTIVMVVKSVFPRNRWRGRRVRYNIWIHTPGDEHPIDWVDFWRNGKPVKHPHFLRY